MKKLILLVLLLLTMNSYAQDAWYVVKDVHPDISCRYTFWKSAYDMGLKDVKVMVRKMPNRMLSEGVNNHDAVQQVNDKLYIVYLTSNKEVANNLREIADHVNTHIKQMAEGRLIPLENGKFIFDGVVYDKPENRKEHRGLPFEKEAFNSFKRFNHGKN